ncbi:MAG TPA: hypothetical protein VE174_01480 [Actinomycetota bacterium]|nr:hypothetical protein [Actinomycetota bacterium]
MKKIRLLLVAVMAASSVALIPAPAQANCEGDLCPVVVYVCAKTDKYRPDGFCETS